MTNFIASLANIDLIIAVGSVEGMLVSAAIVRLMGKFDIEVGFTDAHSFKPDVDITFPRRVLFIGGLVKPRSASMMKIYVDNIRKSGGTIVGVLDEHRAEWLEILGSFEGLEIEPQPASEKMGEKGLARLVDEYLEADCEVVDSHTRHLLFDAFRAHHGNYTCSGFAQWAAVVCAEVTHDRKAKMRHTTLRFGQYDIMDNVMRSWWEVQMCLRWYAFPGLEGQFPEADVPRGIRYAARSIEEARAEVLEHLVIRNEMNFPQFQQLDDVSNFVLATPVIEGKVLTASEFLSLNRVKPIE